MTQRPTFDEIQKQHQELLDQISKTDAVDPDDPRVKVFLEGVSGFLNILAQAGTYTENSERRSLLRDYIRYWSSEINKKTGNFPIVQLQPFTGRHTRRTVLKVGLVGLGLGLTATGVVVIRSLPANQFNVYTDAGDSGNHYVPSGFMGDIGAITLTKNWTDHPHSGTTCIRVVYSGIATQGNRWAGVFWQDPPNNWGTLPGGYDLSHYSKLSFWVRGQSGREQIHFFVGGIQGPHGDSLQPTLYARTDDTNWITLTTSWQLVTINLKGQNLTHIIGAFGWSTNNNVNPQGATFYLDDIVYLV